MKSKGITLVEVLVVIAIIAAVSAFIYPSIARAKMSSKIAASKVNLKHFWQGLELYRQDNDGQLAYGRLEQMGLPPAGRGYANFLKSYSGDPNFTWEKHRDLCPCGIVVNNDEMFRGLIYFGILIDNWPIDVEKYQENTVILADKNCNDSSVRIDCQFCKKRSIGVTLGGQIRDRVNSERKVYDQRFFQP